MRYFEYEKVARKAGIPPDKMARLLRLIRQEFPQDDLMYELHVLRACMAIRDGHLNLEEMLKGEPAETDRGQEAYGGK
jgi:hypothetical protein